MWKIKISIMKKIFNFFVIVLSLTSMSFAQSDKLENTLLVPNYTVVENFYSESIDDTFYVYLKLPKEYDSKISYPVIYLMDGDITFTMAYSIVRYLQYDGEVPDVIIVGVGYGSLINGSSQNMRTRDYSISKIDGIHNSGGAHEFYNFFTKALIPSLEDKYNVDRSNRVIFGHSLSGLFGLYALIENPNYFSGFILSSPYTANDIDFILRRITNDGFNKFDSKLFISFGEYEESELYKEPIMNIIDKLKNIVKNEKNIYLKQIEETTHFSAPSIAFTKGLQYIFKNDKEKN